MADRSFFWKQQQKKQRGPKDIHFETSNKFAPLLTGNTDEVTKCSSTNIALAYSKKSHPIKLISHFERKRRPDICATEKYFKNFTPVTIAGNSNYSSISKNGRKILLVGHSHVNRIRRIDFNKELRNGKTYFRSFSGATSKQLDHYTILSLVDNEPGVVIIVVGTNDILYNASYEDIIGNIINGSNCKSHGVNNVLFSSILVKNNPALNALIRRVNDICCAISALFMVLVLFVMIW